MVACASRTVFCSFRRKYCFSRKKLFYKKIFSIQFLIKKVLFIFSVRWPLFLKNGHVPPKFFFTIFSKNVAFFEKIVERKIFKTSFPIKKNNIRFRCQTAPSLQKRLGPQKWFFAILSENTARLEKPVE